jgi:cholesterol transport system auxiliary component
MKTSDLIARRRLSLCLAGMTLSLSACGLLPKVSEPVDLYTLTPKTTFPDGLPKVDWQLAVEEPLAPPSLDTPRIALQHSLLTLEYYAKASWTDNAPAMVQTMLVESFETSGSIRGVGRDAISLRADYLLKTDLRAFQAVYDGTNPVPTIWIRLNAKMIKIPERRIIASRTFERKLAAASGKLVDVIGAFDETLGKVLKEIVLFTLQAPSSPS